MYKTIKLVLNISFRKLNAISFNGPEANLFLQGLVVFKHRLFDRICMVKIRLFSSTKINIILRKYHEKYVCMIMLSKGHLYFSSKLCRF